MHCQSCREQSLQHKAVLLVFLCFEVQILTCRFLLLLYSHLLLRSNHVMERLGQCHQLSALVGHPMHFCRKSLPSEQSWPAEAQRQGLRWVQPECSVQDSSQVLTFSPSVPVSLIERKCRSLNEFSALNQFSVICVDFFFPIWLWLSIPPSPAWTRPFGGDSMRMHLLVYL